MATTALDEARDVIYGDRERTHGNPARNLNAIAEMWTAYLAVKLDQLGVEISPNLNAKDVCAMMNLVKVARFANDQSHRDNVVDGIGYWALVERVDEAG